MYKYICLSKYEYKQMYMYSNSNMPCSTPRWSRLYNGTLQHNATHWNSLQHTATHCNTLQHIATHCNTLQHIATHCNTQDDHGGTMFGLLYMYVCICMCVCIYMYHAASRAIYVYTYYIYIYTYMYKYICIYISTLLQIADIITMVHIYLLALGYIFICSSSMSRLLLHMNM